MTCVALVLLFNQGGRIIVKNNEKHITALL